MSRKPDGGEGRNFLQRTGLLEQMRRARHEHEIPDAERKVIACGAVRLDGAGIPGATMSSAGASTDASTLLPARSGRPPRETIARTASGMPAPRSAPATG